MVAAGINVVVGGSGVFMATGPTGLQEWERDGGEESSIRAFPAYLFFRNDKRCRASCRHATPCEGHLSLISCEPMQTAMNCLGLQLSPCTPHAAQPVYTPCNSARVHPMQTHANPCKLDPPMFASTNPTLGWHWGPTVQQASALQLASGSARGWQSEPSPRRCHRRPSRLTAAQHQSQRRLLLLWRLHSSAAG